MFIDITTNNVTADANHKVTIAGTSKFANQTIKVLEGGVQLGETQTDGNGKWSVQITLGDGAHNITASIPGAKDDTESVTVTMANPVEESEESGMSVTFALVPPPSESPSETCSGSKVCVSED